VTSSWFFIRQLTESSFRIPSEVPLQTPNYANKASGQSVPCTDGIHVLQHPSLLLHVPKVRGSCRKQRRGQISLRSHRAALAAPYVRNALHLHLLQTCVSSPKSFCMLETTRKWRALFRNEDEEQRFDVLHTPSIHCRRTVFKVAWHKLLLGVRTLHPTPSPTLSNTKLPSEMCQSSLLLGAQRVRISSQLLFLKLKLGYKFFNPWGLSFH
jgi:hypothetical protein